MASAASTATAPVRPAELARRLGVSRQAVSDLVRRGILTPDANGRIDEAAARAAILSSVHPTSKTVQAAQASAPAPIDPVAAAPAPAVAPAAAPQPEAAATNYHVAKTMREAAEAHIARLKLAEMRGELIRTDAVRAVMSNIFATTREAVLQMPARLAPLLAAESDPAAVQNLLHAELHAALESLANSPAAIEHLAAEPAQA